MTTIQDVKSQLEAIATQSGAGVYIIDDILAAMHDQAPLVGNVQCGPTALKVANARLAFLGTNNATIKSVKDNLIDAIKSSTCGYAPYTSSATFKNKLAKHLPSYNVYGYPSRTVTTARGTKLITFEYTARSTKREASFEFAPDDRDMAPSATVTLRAHADGRATFKAWGPGRKREARVVAAPVLPEGSYDITFKDTASNDTYKFRMAKGRETIVPGDLATLYVNDADKSVMRVDKWLNKAQQYHAAVKSAKKTSNGTYEVTFKDTGSEARPFEAFVFNPLADTSGPMDVFPGDLADVYAAYDEGKKKMVIVASSEDATKVRFTSWTSEYEARVRAATYNAQAKTWDVVFEDTDTAQVFMPFAVAEGATAGDVAIVHARKKGEQYQVAKIKTWIGHRVPNVTTPPQYVTEGPIIDGTQAPVDPETPAPGLRINLKIANDNENEAEAAGDGGGRGAGPFFGGVPGLVGVPGVLPGPGEVATDAPAATSDNVDTSNAPAVLYPPVQPVMQQAPCPPAPTCPRVLPEGTFFCMTRKTFMLVAIMLVAACVMACLGYYIWRKKGGGAAAAGGGGGGDLGFGGDLGGLDLGGPGGPR